MMRRGTDIFFLVLILMIGWEGMTSEAWAMESLLPRNLPEGWARVETPRIYNKKTLFERINGQAELFFKYGFQKSIFANYQNRKNPEHQIELDLYDMGNGLQAFGIFSRFRLEERPIGIGLDSYFDDRSALFYKNKYFIMLFSTETNPSSLKEWAKIVSLRITGNAFRPKEMDYFPPEGFKPGSIQYFTEGLLGHQFLERGFQATYLQDKVEVEEKNKEKAEAKEFQLFLAIFKNSEEARRGLKTYKDYLSQKGKIDSKGPGGIGPNGIRGKDPYQGQIIVIQKRNHLLGAVGFEASKQAEDRLTEFTKRVR